MHVKEDERFVREGDDLITVLDVPAPLAALGSSFEVPTLTGTAPVEVAAGTQPGEVLTLRGQGMARLQRHGHGDLRVVVNVQIPRRLSDQQRRMLERFNATITPENLRSDESLFTRLRRALHVHNAR
jgi:molecular chaperone DnaJ